MTDYSPPNGCNPRKIICAANQYGDIIIPSARHHDKRMNALITTLGGRSKLLENINYGDLEEYRKEQGFIDQYGDYWCREDAYKIVTMNKQTIQHEDICRGGRLYSENLY
jgi:hypothetical protein